MDTVLVIGAGVMGRGISASFARAGIRTQVLDIDPSRLANLAANVEAFDRLPATPPQLVIETITERPDLKAACYTEVEVAYPQGVALASNTSSLDLEALASVLKRPQHFLGIHYFMPADVSPLVEVAPVRATDPKVVDRAVALLERSGKQCLRLKRPVQGLIANRLQHAILHEAYQLIDRGVVTAREIDLIAKKVLGPRMCVTGLIEQKDLSGLETHALVQRALVPTLFASRAPARCVQERYACGDLGISTGKGFYDWRGRDPEQIKADAAAKLARVLAVLPHDPLPPLAD